MMKGILPSISLILCLTTVAAVHAADDELPAWETVPACRARLKNHVVCFSTHARAAMAVCSLQWQLANMTGAFDKASACLSTSQQAMIPFYQAALKTIAKKKDAVSALKEAYSYWVSAVKGLSPAIDETAMTYRLRTSEYKQGLEQRLTRLEIEK